MKRIISAILFFSTLILCACTEEDNQPQPPSDDGLSEVTLIATIDGT